MTPSGKDLEERRETRNQKLEVRKRIERRPRPNGAVARMDEGDAFADTGGAGERAARLPDKSRGKLQAAPTRNRRPARFSGEMRTARNGCATKKDGDVKSPLQESESGSAGYRSSSMRTGAWSL